LNVAPCPPERVTSLHVASTLIFLSRSIMSSNLLNQQTKFSNLLCIALNIDIIDNMRYEKGDGLSIFKVDQHTRQSIHIITFDNCLSYKRIFRSLKRYNDDL